MFHKRGANHFSRNEVTAAVEVRTSRCAPASDTAGSRSNKMQGRQQHVSISFGIEARQTARQYCCCGAAGGTAPDQNYFYSRSSENQSAHKRSRGQRRVDKIGCGHGCWLALGSGRLSPPKLINIAGVEQIQTTQRFRISEASRNS